jgi:hypothetical protein
VKSGFAPFDKYYIYIEYLTIYGFNAVNDFPKTI